MCGNGISARSMIQGTSMVMQYGHGGVSLDKYGLSGAVAPEGLLVAHTPFSSIRADNSPGSVSAARRLGTSPSRTNRATFASTVK